MPPGGDVPTRPRPCRRLPWYDGGVARMLASAEAMLEGTAWSGQPAIRWYVTRERALVLGASQKPDAVDAAACRAAGVAVYQRAAGGTAVLVDADMLGLDVALPRDDPLVLSDLTWSYRWLGEVWATALRGLGVDATPIAVDEARAGAGARDETARLARLACFGALSPFEVTVGRRKVVGLAQVRRRSGVLFPTAVLLRSVPRRLSGLLAVTPPERATLTAALEEREAGLEEIMGRSALPREVIAACEAALVDRGLTPTDVDWTPEEEALTDRLLAERYQPLPL